MMSRWPVSFNFLVTIWEIVFCFHPWYTLRKWKYICTYTVHRVDRYPHHLYLRHFYFLEGNWNKQSKTAFFVIFRGVVEETDKFTLISCFQIFLSPNERKKHSYVIWQSPGKTPLNSRIVTASNDVCSCDRSQGKYSRQPYSFIPFYIDELSITPCGVLLMLIRTIPGNVF